MIKSGALFDTFEKAVLDFYPDLRFLARRLQEHGQTLIKTLTDTDLNTDSDSNKHGLKM